MAAISSYQKKLITHLTKQYTQDQIDEFSWYPDKEDSSSYKLDFVDHNYHRNTLTLDKTTGQIRMADLGEVEVAWS